MIYQLITFLYSFRKILESHLSKRVSDMNQIEKFKFKHNSTTYTISRSNVDTTWPMIGLDALSVQALNKVIEIDTIFLTRCSAGIE